MSCAREHDRGCAGGAAREQSDGGDSIPKPLTATEEEGVEAAWPVQARD